MSRKKSPPPVSLGSAILQTLVRFVTSQCILMIAVSLTVWAILSLLEVRFAFTLAVLTGVFSVIPAIGMFIAALISTFVAIVDGTRFLGSLPAVFEGIVIFLLFMILNFLIDYFLSPFVLGKLNNIHPFILIIAVLVGTIAFGIAGTILSVPAVLIIRTIMEHSKR